MAELMPRRKESDPSVERRPTTGESSTAATGDSSSTGARKSSTDRTVDAQRSGAETSSLTDTLPFRVGHALFGAVLAFMALDNLRNLEERIGYAESKGAPMPETAVPAISSSLFVGSLGLAVWRAPATAASAVAAFFVTVTPVMHDFWALDDPEEAQAQQIHFLKNSALLGATLAFLGIGLRED